MSPAYGSVDRNSYPTVMYLLDKLKPFEQKGHFSYKEQNGSEWYLAYVCVGPVLK